MASGPRYTYIDLFAGCGGLSLGLYNAGWEGLFAVEKNPMAFATLKYNLIDKKQHYHWPKWLAQKNINIDDVLKYDRNELGSLKGKINLVAGGPPCQGFSFAGRRDEQDQRNQLVHSYLKFVELVEPEVVFFENVRGFTVKFAKKASKGIVYSDLVESRLKKLGFNPKSDIINFSEYGIPQRRNRFILVGIRGGDAETFFEKLKQNKKSFFKKKSLPEIISARDAISDLERCHGERQSPDSKNFKAGKYGPISSNYQELMRKNAPEYPDSHRFVNHTNKTKQRFQFYLENFPKNKNINQDMKESLNLRKHCITPMDPDLPSPSLTTLPDDYIHYSEPRVLTVREFARLQSFDDWFEFRDKYTTGGSFRTSEVPRYTQVGNAIPPLFVEQAGLVIKSMI